MRYRRSVTAALLAAVALFACEQRPGPVSPLTPDGASQNPSRIGLVVSSLDAGVGERITLTVRASGDARLAALQGALSWDPARLRFAGQVPAAGTIVAVGPRGGGAVEIAAVAPHGLPLDVAVLAFEVLAGGYDVRLAFEPHIAADGSGQQLAWAAEPLVTQIGLPDALAARVMDRSAWTEVLAPGLGVRPARVPGSGWIFGDPTLDGSINVLDALAVSLRSVGVEEIIVGTDAPDVDPVVAANVVPFNLPGIGEAGDQCAPGVDACGAPSRTINVLDALAISLESVGEDQPVVGEAIPRASASGSSVLTGSLTSTRTLSPDTTYQLVGTLRVEAGGVLIAPPGTRIGGTPGALIVVGRTGRIEVRGTHLDPVVMTCEDGQEVRGCWAGLVIAGNAPINRGGQTSPSAPGSGQFGCLEVADDPLVGAFGGCDPDDDRGVLTYLRLEFATRGLALLGVGRGTLVDEVQVHGSQTAGVTVGGGTVDLRHVLVTAPLGDGLAWQDGWVGRSQFVVVQLDPVSGRSGVSGRNVRGNPSALPFSRPTLFNTTVVGIDFPPTGAAVELSEGTGAVIRNLVAVGLPDPGAGLPYALDIDGAVTCDRVGTGDIVLATSVFAGIDSPADPDSEPGCAGSPLAEDAVLAVGANATVTGQAAIATLIKSATDPFLPDFRGTPVGGLSGFPASAPPNDGFFDATATYAGGSGVANLASPNIPWYAGWTRGGLGISLPFGSIQGTVSDGVGPVSGVGVVAAAGDFGAVSDPVGHFELEFVRTGPTTVTLSDLPTDCVDPGAIPVSVVAGIISTLDIDLGCGGADVSVSKAGPTLVAAGDTAVYVVTTSNLGPSAALEVVVTDTLPSGMTFLGATRSGAEAGGVVAWPAVTLSNGQVVADTVFALAPVGEGDGVNIAAAESATLDPDPSNNDGSDTASRVATTFETSADVSVSKTGPAEATVGDTVVYQITTTNSGPSDAEEVIVADTLPPAVAFLSATRSAAHSGGVVTWAATSLADGAVLVDTVMVVATAVGEQLDVAAAASSTADPSHANNVAPLTTTVGAAGSGLVWEAEFADGATPTTVLIGHVAVSVTASDPSAIGRPRNFTVEHGALGAHAGHWVADIDATSRAQTVSFALGFSQMVDSLRFTVLDVDRRVASPQFQDSVVVVGWNGVAAFAPVVESIGSEVHESAPGALAGETEVSGTTAANVALRFDQPVDSVTFVYGPGPLSPANPAQQTIGLSDLTWSLLTVSGGAPPPLPPSAGGAAVPPESPPYEGPLDN